MGLKRHNWFQNVRPHDESLADLLLGDYTIAVSMWVESLCQPRLHSDEFKKLKIDYFKAKVVSLQSLCDPTKRLCQP